METKVINVSIGRTIEATQYDAGQVLVFDGIDIPDGSEAHFSNQKINEKTVINNNQCDIPDNILQIGGKGMLSVYVINEDSSRTVYDFLILIKKRAELPDGIAPEHQQSFEEKIVEMFNETKAIAENIEQRANNGEFNGKDGENGKDGKDGMPGKSAYEIAIDGGYEGTEAQWIASLKGEKGDSDSVTENVFDEDSTNAVANNILLNFFKTGSLNMKELVNGDITLYPTWEFGALNEKGENNDTSTRIRTKDYIEIDDNPITISALTSSVGFAYCLYNSNKELSGGQVSKYQTGSVTIESSDTIKYVRVWSNTINVSKATELISIIKNIKTDEKVIVSKKLMYNKEEIDNMGISGYWKDKTVIFTGDSIPHGQTMQGNVDKPYPNIVAEKLGMKLINYSIGGSTFACKEDYGGCFANGTEFNNTTKDTSKIYDVINGQSYNTYKYDSENNKWIAAKIGDSRTPLSERIKLMSDGDLIIYAGGTNDFQYNWTEVGTMTDRTNNTFYGALHNTCLALLEKYKGKQIIFCTPIKRCQSPYTTIESKNDYNLTLKDYGNIIKEVCDYYSIPIIDLYSISGLNPHIQSQLSYFDNYKTHPLQEGHNTLGSVVASAIRGIRSI